MDDGRSLGLSSLDSGQPAANGDFGALLNRALTTSSAVAANQPLPAVPADLDTLRKVAQAEGAPDALVPVIAAIYGQESGSGRNPATSVNGARGGMQILPSTFKAYARPGESIDNPEDNLRVGVRLIRDLGDKFGGDPAKVATAYFSGEGNVNRGAGVAWRNDAADGNGKRVSSYVSDIVRRAAGIGSAQAAPPATPTETSATGPDLTKAPKWADIEQKAAFQALPAAEKAQAKEAYFDYWIAPNVGPDAPALRQQFLATPISAGPGALDRAWQAVKDTAGQAVRELTPGSVMAGAAPQVPDTPTTSRAPVTAEQRARFAAGWDAASPGERATLAARPDWIGQLARERAGQFAQQDEVGGAALQSTDPRAEARRVQMLAQGADPRFAARAAQAGAAAGALPGQEEAALPGVVARGPGVQREGEGDVVQTGLAAARNLSAAGSAAVIDTGAYLARLTGATQTADTLHGAARSISQGTEEYNRALNGWQRLLVEGAGIAGQLPSFVAAGAAGGSRAVMGLMAGTMGAPAGEAAREKFLAAGDDPTTATAKSIPVAAANAVIGAYFGRALKGAVAKLATLEEPTIQDAVRASLARAGEWQKGAALQIALGTAESSAFMGTANGVTAALENALGAQHQAVLPAIVEGVKTGLLLGAVGAPWAAKYARDSARSLGWAAGTVLNNEQSPAARRKAADIFHDAIVGAVGKERAAEWRANVEEAIRFDEASRRGARTVDGQSAPAVEPTALPGRPDTPDATPGAPAPAPEPNPSIGPGSAGLADTAPRAAPPATTTADGRLEPTPTPPAAAPAEAAGAPAVHPMVQAADAIVGELADTAGVRRDVVLPAAPAPTSGPTPVSDEDILGLAQARFLQLRDKRNGLRQAVAAADGSMVDQDLPGVALSPEEQAEFDGLVAARNDPDALRRLYGLDQPAPSDASQLAGQGQAPAATPASAAEQPTPGADLPPAGEPGLAAVQENENGQVQDGQGPAAGPAPSALPGSADGQAGGPAAVAQPAADAAGAQGRAPDGDGNAGQQAAGVPAASAPVGPGAPAASTPAALVAPSAPAGPMGRFKTAPEAALAIQQQRRNSSVKLPRALPLPLPDGTFDIAIEGSPEWPAAQAFAEGKPLPQRRIDPATGEIIEEPANGPQAAQTVETAPQKQKASQPAGAVGEGGAPGAANVKPAATPPKTEIEANIARGAAAMEKVISKRGEVAHAMLRPGRGWVSFLWGKEGDPAKSFADGYGVAKIIAKRTAEGADGQAVARKMVEVIAHGEESAPYGPPNAQRLNVKYDGHTAVLSLYRFGKEQTWLLTGWDDVGSGDAGAVNATGAYAPESSGIRAQEGADRANIPPAAPTSKPTTERAAKKQRAAKESTNAPAARQQPEGDQREHQGTGARLQGDGENRDQPPAGSAPGAESGGGDRVPQGGQSAEVATHVEGKTAEPATGPVIIRALAKGGDLQGARADAVEQVQAAAAKAPPMAQLGLTEVKGRDGKVSLEITVTKPSKAKANATVTTTHVAIESDLKQIGYATIEIEGDGKFRVLNTQEHLQRFADKLEKAAGLKPVKSKPRTTKVNVGSGAAAAYDSTIREMWDAGELVSALELARLTGRDIAYGTAEKEGERPLVFVNAEDVAIGPGADTFVGRVIDGGEWRVVEKSTGLKLGWGNSKDAAVKMARERAKGVDLAERIAATKARPGQEALAAEVQQWVTENDIGAVPESDVKTKAAAPGDLQVGDIVRFGNTPGIVVGVSGDSVRFRPDNANSPKAYHSVPKTSLQLVARPDTAAGSAASKKPAGRETFGEEQGKLDADMGGLIQLLGANMYGSNIADVAVKELLQNSFDAVKGAISNRSGKQLYSAGKITISLDEGTRTITVQDDARGMTPEIVRKAFFTLAGSDKSDLDPSERSGGLGVAKMGFMMGAERLRLDTVRDGVRTTVDTTALEIANSNFKIVKSPASPDEHGTTVTVSIPKYYVDPMTKEERHIYWPWHVIKDGKVTHDVLSKPLIGPVEITVKTLYNGTERESAATATGKNFDESKYQAFKVNFSWGSADVYFGVERKDNNAKHSVLSSGVYQFDQRFSLNDKEKVPYDIIINVKAKVDAKHPDYPFENSRERFKARLDEDIKSLTAYLGKIARGHEAEDLQANFKGIVSMPRLEAGKELADAAAKLKKVFDKRGEGSEQFTLPPLPKEVTVQGEQVLDQAGDALVDRARERIKQQETKKESTFTAETQAKTAADFMLQMTQNPKLPIFHNNTNVDFIAAGEKYGDPRAFFAELGTLMVEMKETLAASGFYGYDVLAPDNLFFGGISVDKQYGGVHIKVPYKAVLLNPFYNWGARTLFGVQANIMNTMIHEIAHTGDMDHGVGHNSHIVKVEQYLADEGLLDYYRDAVLDILRRHESTFTAMREAYGQSTTRNVAKSLEDYGKDAAGASIRGAASRRVDAPGPVPAGEESGRGGAVRGDRADDRPGEELGGGGRVGEEGVTGRVAEPGPAYTDPYAHLQTRPGTVEAQKEAGEAALADLRRRLALDSAGRRLGLGRGDLAVLGSTLYRNFVASGGNQLVGQYVATAADLAALAQVYRDPRFETFRVIYLKGQQVAGEAGYTSRLPALIQLPNNMDALLAQDMQRFGADGYWILHNHPSGSSAPSTADARLTRDIASNAPGFRGHVVIDHNEYTVIDSSGRHQTIAAPALAGKDFKSAPSVPHPLLGTMILGPRDAATMAKRLQTPNAHGTLVLTDRRGRVNLIVDAPLDALRRGVEIPKIKAIIRRMTRETGSGGHRMLVIPASEALGDFLHLTDSGVVSDVINANGDSAVDTLNRSVNFDEFTGGIKSLRIYAPGSKYEKEWRVFQRDLADLTRVERRELDAYLKTRADGKDVLARLKKLAGTPWAKQAIEGIFVRRAIDALIAGKQPAAQSMLDNSVVAKTRALLEKKGEAGLWHLLEAQGGLIGHASKPVNNVNSSFINCNPTDECAQFCYAADLNSNYKWPAVLVRSEIITAAVERDPVRAARRVAGEYKSMADAGKKALRLFDKGDGGPQWIPFIKELNDRGVRVQVFSKLPDFLRQVPAMNLRLLSVDSADTRLADANPDLPVSFIYSGPQQLDALAKLAARNQIGVVLPVKIGRRVLDTAMVAELKSAVPAAKPYLCPIDGGVKKIGANAGEWNCTKCDAGGGVGCFHGRVTEQIMRSADAKPANPQAVARAIQELRTQLHDLAAQGTGQPVAAPGSLRPGDAARLHGEVGALLGQLLQHYGAGKEAGGAGQPAAGTGAPGDGAQGHVRGRKRTIPIVAKEPDVGYGDAGSPRGGEEAAVEPPYLAGLKARRTLQEPGAGYGGPPGRNIAQRVANNVLQFFGNRDPGLKTFGLYDRTLATQYHKALKDPHYGKVYGLALAMQNEVSLTAIRPAELAPGVLPRVDDVASAVRTAIKDRRGGKDLAGAAGAIFAGTLDGANVVSGRVWTDAELRSRFHLTDTGVALYRQARAAIDASLDETAAAEAFALAQSLVGRGMRRQIIDNPSGAESLVLPAIDAKIAVIDQALQRAAGAPARAAQLAHLQAVRDEYAETRRKVEEVFTTARNLKDGGYAPLMRFGKYSVTAQEVDPTTGEVARDANGDPVTLFYRQYETEVEAQEAQRALEAHFGGQDVLVRAGVKSNKAHELYNGVSPETLALFAQAVGANEAMRKYIEEALGERSALKRRLERRAIEGFNTDMPRVLSNFITSNARFAAQRYYMRDLNAAIRAIPQTKGDVRDEAIALKQFLTNPNDPAAPVSSMMFAWFLGGSVASAAVNLTQPVLMTWPYLTRWGVEAASTEMAKALPYAMGMKQITDPALRAALKRASQEGIVDAQEIFHLYSLGAQGVASGLVSTLARIPWVREAIKAGSASARARINAFLTLWGSMFAVAEKFNRKVSFIAAWNMAIQRGEANPYAVAVRAVNETQGVYNKVNRPNWARSPVGRTVLTFKQFSIMWVELLSRMWKKGGSEGKRAALVMLAMLMLAAGEEGLPFAQDLDDLIDTVGQMFGLDTNMKRNKRRLAYDILGKALGDLFLYGISAHLPLDFSGRMGLGNLIPGTGMFKKSNVEQQWRQAAEIAGPAAGMGMQIADAYDAAVAGNWGKMLENIGPKAVKDVMAGSKMIRTGYAENTRGEQTIPVTPAEGAIKMTGFQPTAIAQESRKTAPIAQDKALQALTEREIVQAWGRAIANNDNEGALKAQRKLEAWNRDNPENPIVITAAQIKASVKSKLTGVEERMLKHAPKEMRGRVAGGLADVK